MSKYEKCAETARNFEFAAFHFSHMPKIQDTEMREDAKIHFGFCCASFISNGPFAAFVIKFYSGAGANPKYLRP